MKFDPSDLEKGIYSGCGRANLYFKEGLAPQNLSNLNTKLAKVFQAYPSQLNSRFVNLFAELAGIAETSRFIYREPFLKEEELSLFLSQAVTFFDSFTHA